MCALAIQTVCVSRCLMRRVVWLMVLGICGPISPHLLASAANTQSKDYDRAEALVRDHRWDDGLAVLSPLLKSEPHNLKALNLAGLALTGKGDTKQANKYFQQALLLNSAFVPALKNLSINEFNERQYELAEQHLRAAEKDSPDDPIVNLYLGEIYYGKHEYGPA
jgi:tetratricopeptide (TPR) repeat protein